MVKEVQQMDSASENSFPQTTKHSKTFVTYHPLSIVVQTV